MAAMAGSTIVVAICVRGYTISDYDFIAWLLPMILQLVRGCY